MSLVDVTAGTYRGISTPISTLYDECHRRGWQVQKITFKSGEYSAKAKSPHGETVEKTGPTPETALGHVLVHIIRQHAIRNSAWNHTWTDKMVPIAHAYAKAPVFDHKAAGAWKELADDNMARAQMLHQQMNVEYTHDPNPYHDPQQMFEDVNKGKIKVSQGNTHHPVWNHAQVLAHRLCHAVLGQAAGGADFGWHGANTACAHHMPYLTPSAQRALFSETVGRSAYLHHFGQEANPHKIAFMDDFEKDQEKNNPDNFSGESIKNTLPPMKLDKTSGIQRDPNYQYDTGISPPYPNAFLDSDPLEYQKTAENARLNDTGWSQWTTPGPDGEPIPDMDRIKQAVSNALRAALLSPRKLLRHNAAHLQDMDHVPYHVTDPAQYYDALNNARISHNRAMGYADPEISHKTYYPLLLKYYKYYAAHNPGLSPSEVKTEVDREMMVMETEEEKRIDAEDRVAPAEIIVQKVDQAMKQRLQDLMGVVDNSAKSRGPVKPEKHPFLFSGMGDDGSIEDTTDIPLESQPAYQTTQKGKYGAFTNGSLYNIAGISQHIDQITEAALEDVKEGGQGWHFRQALLSLNLPGVGPKVASFAWLLLQPMTSQLATMDTHMLQALGHPAGYSPGNRDYFKAERQLQAIRDASGYGDMPLGQAQWTIWDAKRGGPGTHQDHTPLSVDNPTPHYQNVWHDVIEPKKGEKWLAPNWITATQPYQDAVGQDWDDNVVGQRGSPGFVPQDAIPYSEEDALMPVTSALFGPPQINEVDAPPARMHGFQNMRPFLYTPASNAIHVGPYGSFHNGVEQAAGIPREGQYRGTMFGDGRALWQTSMGTPVDQSRVEKALADQYGVDFNRPFEWDNEDAWKESCVLSNGAMQHNMDAWAFGLFGVHMGEIRLEGHHENLIGLKLEAKSLTRKENFSILEFATQFGLNPYAVIRTTKTARVPPFIFRADSMDNQMGVNDPMMQTATDPMPSQDWIDHGLKSVQRCQHCHDVGTIQMPDGRRETCPYCTQWNDAQKMDTDSDTLSNPHVPDVNPGVHAHAAPKPPNLREGNNKKNCGNCTMFDKGKCWGYGLVKVDKMDLCDSWELEGKKASGETWQAPDKPLTIQEVDAKPYDKGRITGLEERRPYIYDLENHNIIVGPNGAYHAQILKHLPSPAAYGRGYVMNNGEIGDYDGYPEVAQQLATQLGPPHYVAPSMDQEKWSYVKVAAPLGVYGLPGWNEDEDTFYNALTPDRSRYDSVHHPQWWDSLTSEPRHAATSYQGSSVSVNKLLRQARVNDTEYNYETGRDSPRYYGPIPRHLDAAIASHPLMPLPQKLYRGTTVGSIKRAIGNDPSQWQGREFSDHGYASTSILKNSADNFSSGHAPGSAYTMHIYAPKGTPGMYLPDNGYSEHEWLLPRGARFQVLQNPDRYNRDLHVRVTGFDPSVGQANMDKVRQENNWDADMNPISPHYPPAYDDDGEFQENYPNPYDSMNDEQKEAIKNTLGTPMTNTPGWSSPNPTDIPWGMYSSLDKEAINWYPKRMTDRSKRFGYEEGDLAPAPSTPPEVPIDTEAQEPEQDQAQAVWDDESPNAG